MTSGMQSPSSSFARAMQHLSDRLCSHQPHSRLHGHESLEDRRPGERHGRPRQALCLLCGSALRSQHRRHRFHSDRPPDMCPCHWCHPCQWHCSCLQKSFPPRRRLVFCRCLPREFEKASPKITGERQSPRQRERACPGCRCKQAAVPARRSTHVDDLSVASRRASSPSHLNPSSLSHSTLLADAGCC